ncbi:helix-turn-helix domain-containing protein [Nocardiopsis alborubida]|nr:helix-turn-helix transcriptional regulator [Nocardiopsis alborubida]
MSRPTASVARRIVARVMRDARIRNGITATNAASVAGFAQGTLTKYERAENPFPKTVVYRLADFYGLDPEVRDKLVDLAGQRTLGWWQVYKDIPDWFATYVAFESEALEVSTYQDSVIPGLLQTPDYARALLASDVRSGTFEQIEAQVEVRTQRQARLTGENPLRLHTVFNEAALHRPGGDTETMRRQLEFLIERAELDNIRLQVLPFDAGVHTASETSFMIMKFPDLLENVEIGDLVYIEYRLGSLYLEEASETEAFQETFEHVHNVALSPPASIELIQQVIETRYARNA